jgi:hypothetical protein
MKYSEKVTAEKAFFARLDNETMKRSTGSIGKMLDYLCRDYIMAHGVEKADDVRCRHQDKADAVVYVNGKRKAIEVKSACGAVMYGKGLSKADILPDNIYPRTSYIVYTAEVAFINRSNFAELMLVFTRDEFVQMLEDTGKHGLLSSLKVGKQGGQIEIQPWATKACSARLNKFYDWVDEHGIPTLEEFKQGLRG